MDFHVFVRARTRIVKELGVDGHDALFGPIAPLKIQQILFWSSSLIFFPRSPTIDYFALALQTLFSNS